MQRACELRLSVRPLRFSASVEQTPKVEPGLD
jgi:hypothetical protein